jgi:hypothetical protein
MGKRRVAQLVAMHRNRNGRGRNARWSLDLGLVELRRQRHGNPAVIFGQKPGTRSTSPALPKKINSISVATVAYDVFSSHKDIGNTAFDLWLTNTHDPSVFAVPPITHEIMIWLESYGGMRPDGAFVEQAFLDGSTYDVFVAENIGKGWRYIAFEE